MIATCACCKKDSDSYMGIAGGVVCMECVPYQIIKMQGKYLAHLNGLKYEDYLLTEHWRQTRDAVFAKQGRVCHTCGETKDTQVHHVTYENKGRELETDLIVLCGPCHGAIHKHGGMSKKCQ